MDPVRRALDGLAPDVVLLQECGSGRATLRLARALQMESVSSHRPFNRVRNAVLFRTPWRVLELDVRNLARQGKTLRRGFVAAHLWRPGSRVTAVSVHLGLSERERERHARELTDALFLLEGSTIIGADLNEGPAGSAARWIGERYFDAFQAGGEGPGETFPAGAPTVRIDYLFVSDGVGVARAWVPDVPGASDHRPIVADLDLSGSDERRDV